jgi:hypothetical protein
MPVTQAFDKFLLIGCICVVLSLTLYFFYWNRLIAFLLGWFFRFLYWNQGPFSIWLEIGIYAYPTPEPNQPSTLNRLHPLLHLDWKNID